MRKFLLWCLVIVWLLVAYAALGIGVIFYVASGGWLFGGSFGWSDIITWIGIPCLCTYCFLASQRVLHYIHWHEKVSFLNYR